jgi:hypothetical protein
MHGISEGSYIGKWGLYAEYAETVTAGHMQKGDRLLRREDTVQIGCCMKFVYALFVTGVQSRTSPGHRPIHKVTISFLGHATTQGSFHFPESFYYRPLCRPHLCS